MCIDKRLLSFGIAVLCSAAFVYIFVEALHTQIFQAAFISLTDSLKGPGSWEFWQMFWTFLKYVIAAAFLAAAVYFARALAKPAKRK